ncbi:restriction endonuclease [Rathayibacter sp. AY1B7]|uniref:restriction endonuclease n=1 Tax=Rathayibacter sp. AY1B7 TaxID=2080532 RepID=UPI0011B0E024|nr:restriction endonuclease [Rathayibacter sp. AY1B7]
MGRELQLGEALARVEALGSSLVRLTSEQAVRAEIQSTAQELWSQLAPRDRAAHRKLGARVLVEAAVASWKTNSRLVALSLLRQPVRQGPPPLSFVGMSDSEARSHLGERHREKERSAEVVPRPPKLLIMSAGEKLAFGSLVEPTTPPRLDGPVWHRGPDSGPGGNYGYPRSLAASTNQDRPWREAEREVWRWLIRQGVARARLGRGSRDGGIDIESVDLIVQVKYQTRPISEPAVRDLCGASMIDQKKPVIVSKSGFTSSAFAFADRSGTALFRYEPDSPEPMNAHAKTLLIRLGERAVQ